MVPHICPPIPLGEFLDALPPYPILPGSIMTRILFTGGTYDIPAINTTTITNNADLESYLNDQVLTTLQSISIFVVTGDFKIDGNQLYPPKTLEIKDQRSSCSYDTLFVLPCDPIPISDMLNGFTYPIPAETAQLNIDGIGAIQESFNVRVVTDDISLISMLNDVISSLETQGYLIVGTYHLSGGGVVCPYFLNGPSRCPLQNLIPYKPPVPPAPTP